MSCRKQCVQTNSVFDFLQEIVSKVPDIGPETAYEERNGGRRRCGFSSSFL
jgi:hypothetical protein